MTELIRHDSGGVTAEDEVDPAAVLTMVSDLSAHLSEAEAAQLDYLRETSAQYKAEAARLTALAANLGQLAASLDEVIDLVENRPQPPAVIEQPPAPEPEADPLAPPPISLDEIGQTPGAGKDRKLRFYSPRAGIIMAYHFKSHPGQIVDTDELIKHVYSAEVRAVIPAADLKKSVSTILGPRTQGKRIQAILDVEGMVLQYGWRAADQQTATGSRKVRSRVYRAIKKDELDQRHTHRRTAAGVEYTWELSEEQRNLIDLNKAL